MRDRPRPARLLLRNDVVGANGLPVTANPEPSDLPNIAGPLVQVHTIRFVRSRTDLFAVPTAQPFGVPTTIARAGGWNIRTQWTVDVAPAEFRRLDRPKLQLVRP